MYDKHEEMRVYLDNCCYNRPFDDRGQLKVRLEALAKLAVQLMMYLRKVEYVWSKILDYEISFNPDPKRRASILFWRGGAAEYVDTSPMLRTRYDELKSAGLKHKDALHVASASVSGCDYFLTTDSGILKKISKVGNLTVMNPVQFFMEVAR